MCLDTNWHTTTHFYTLAAQVTSTLFGRNKSKTTTWKAGPRFFPLKLPVQLRPVLFTDLASRGLFVVAAGCATCLPDRFLAKLPKKSEVTSEGEFSDYSSHTRYCQVSVCTTWMSPLHNGGCWWVTSLIFSMWRNLNSAPMLDDVTRERDFFSKVWNWITLQQVAKAS